MKLIFQEKVKVNKYNAPVSVQAQQAQECLDNQTFGDAFQVLKWQYFLQWLQSQNAEEREALHGKVHGLLDAQAEFERLASMNQETD